RRNLPCRPGRQAQLPGRHRSLEPQERRRQELHDQRPALRDVPEKSQASTRRRGEGRVSALPFFFRKEHVTMKNPNRIHVMTAEEALKTVYETVDEKAIAGILSDLRHL